MNLSELIRHHKGDRSFDELAKAGGGVVTSQRLQQMATTKPAEFPKPKGIRAIAKALGVREWVVVMAAAESLGLDVARQVPRLAEVLPAAAFELDDEQVAAIAHVIRAFKGEDVMGNAEHPAPTNVAARGRERQKLRMVRGLLVHRAQAVPVEIEKALAIIDTEGASLSDADLDAAAAAADVEIERMITHLLLTEEPAGGPGATVTELGNYGMGAKTSGEHAIAQLENEAARTPGRQSKGQSKRRASDAAGEPPRNDPDDFDPR